MKVKIGAIVPLIILDLILIGFGVALLAFLFSCWLLFYSFVFAPLLVVIAHLLKLQSFTLWRFALAVIFLAIGKIWIYPFAKWSTKQIKQLFINCLVYHKKVLFKNEWGF